MGMAEVGAPYSNSFVVYFRGILSGVVHGITMDNLAKNLSLLDEIDPRKLICHRINNDDERHFGVCVSVLTLFIFCCWGILCSMT